MQLFIQEDLWFKSPPTAQVKAQIEKVALTKTNTDGFVVLAQRITQPESVLMPLLQALHDLAGAQPVKMPLYLKHWDLETDNVTQFAQLHLRLYSKASQWVEFKLQRDHFPVDDRQVRVLRENGEEGIAQFIYAHEIMEEHVGYWVQFVHPSAIDEIDFLSDVKAWQYID